MTSTSSSQLVYGRLGADLACVSVIMAGGSGTRFWPLSRRTFPKQYLPLSGGSQSLLQATAERMERVSTASGILVVTSEQQAPIVRQQLPDASVLVEHCARNTAACVGYAALLVAKTVGDVPMLCVPADHLIHGLDAVVEVFERGVSLAKDRDCLVTFGIKPTLPETGYGYIRKGDATSGGAFAVRQFVEKPSRVVAEEYLRSGEYFWNSGMFVWRPSVILAAIRTHAPELYSRLEQIDACLNGRADFDEVSRLYQDIKPVSIDVAIMERADNVLMLAGESFGWSDIGSWSSWAETQQEHQDSSGNVSRGDVVLIDSRNCVVLGKDKLVAVVGLEDTIVVESGDALLICRKDRSQDVKAVVDELAKRNRSELL